MDRSQSELLTVFLSIGSVAIAAVCWYSLENFDLGVGGMPWLVGMGAAQPLAVLPILFSQRA